MTAWKPVSGCILVCKTHVTHYLDKPWGVPLNLPWVPWDTPWKPWDDTMGWPMGCSMSSDDMSHGPHDIVHGITHGAIWHTGCSMDSMAKPMEFVGIPWANILYGPSHGIYHGSHDVRWYPWGVHGIHSLSHGISWCTLTHRLAHGSHCTFHEPVIPWHIPWPFFYKIPWPNPRYAMVYPMGDAAGRLFHGIAHERHGLSHGLTQGPTHALRDGLWVMPLPMPWVFHIPWDIRWSLSWHIP